MAMHLAYPSTPAGAPNRAVTRPGFRLTVRRKILLAFLALGGITGALGGYAVSSIATVGQLTEQTYNGALMSISHARAASAAFAGTEAAMLRSAMDGSPGEHNGRVADLLQALTDDLDIALDRALSDDAARA
ncbi:MAG: MCP four helix bundle domain-containing protein, partial [Gemmatimonadaceae bacterium]|nr:MCP four helix bundle domain-containing protein [Acetobacteraceae bacterium]